MVRELELLTPGKRGALRAPFATLSAARATRRLIRSFRPDLIFVWNGAEIPQAAIRMAEYSGAPVAYSVAQHWFGGLYKRDQFMRHLDPGDRGLRALWARLARIVNRHPDLRLEARRKVPASICWVSDALRKGVDVPETVEPLVERVIYTGVHDPEAWIRLERHPASDPPTIAFVGRLEEQRARASPTGLWRHPGPPRHRRAAQARGPRNAGRAARAGPSRTRARHRGSRRAARPRRPGQRGRADGRRVGDRRSLGVARAVGRSLSRGGTGSCAGSRLAQRRDARGAARRGARALLPDRGRGRLCGRPGAGPHRGTQDAGTHQARVRAGARVQLRQLHGPDGRVHLAAVAAHHGGARQQDDGARRHLRRPAGSSARRSKATT